MKSLSYAAGKYPDFAEILKNYTEAESALLGAVNNLLSSKGKDPIQSTPVALSMIGFVPARNFLASLIINKQNKDLTPWDTDIQKLLSFALMGESMGEDLSLRYFTAGLVFDILIDLFMHSDSDLANRKIPQFIQDLWKHGVSVSQTARQLAVKLVPAVDLERDICLDALLHDIGKAAVFFLNGEHLKAEEVNAALIYDTSAGQGHEVRTTAEQVNRRVLPETGWLQEHLSGALPHDVFGHLMLWKLGFLEETSWVTLYHHQPFLASRKNKAVSMRAMLVWLADHLCRYREVHGDNKFDAIIPRYFKVVEKVIKCKFEVFSSSVKSLIFR